MKMCPSVAARGRARYCLSMKLDLFRRHKGEYVAPARYLSVDGRGDPEGGPGFGAAVAAVYAVAYAIKKAKKVKLEALREGRVVQLLHTGPYNREHESLDRMKEFAHEYRLRLTGRHPEIYLSDPRRVRAARLRTLLRRSVRPR
jgi:hypothetical protein